MAAAVDALRRRSRPRLRAAVAIVGPLAIVGAARLPARQQRHEIAAGRASGRASAQLVAVTALALLTLLARTEAVVACLNAMGSRPRTSRHPRRELADVPRRDDQPLRLEHRACGPRAAARPRALTDDPADDHGRHVDDADRGACVVLVLIVVSAGA